MAEEEIEYESNVEEVKLSLKQRRREACDDEEEEEEGGDLRGKPSRRIDGSDRESEGGAAEYEEEENGEEEYVGEEEEAEFEERGGSGAEVAVERADIGEKRVLEVEQSKEKNGVDNDALDIDDGNINVADGQHEEERIETEPVAVPTAGAFYMHDDRFQDNAGGLHRMPVHTERERFGPIDDSVLNQQSTHRSGLAYVSREHTTTLLSTYKGSNSIFWTFDIDGPNDEHIQLHPRVLDRLQLMGFYGAARCGRFKVDRHLITALVERWRPETHTFHFPIGEATVTLQDVAILWGLPIEGHPIICREPKHSVIEWRQYCQMWLGISPADHDMRNKSAIQLTSLANLVKNLAIIGDDTPQMIVDQYARGCALLLLGCLMMPDSSNCSVPLVYLHFLEDINTVGHYSWGSAVLAYLYRALCTASNYRAKTIAGPLTLLQIWAWSRIKVIQPLNVGDVINVQPLMGVDNRNLGIAPFGARWIHYNDYTRTASNNIRVYRDIFDRLFDQDFIWQPYDMRSPDISTLGPRCLTENWMSECPLININIVEIHHPSRVLRQFGRVQSIPPDVETTHRFLHEHDRKGKSGYDWVRQFADWIIYWGQRQPFEPAEMIYGSCFVTNDYMSWYYRITRRLISPDYYDREVPGFQPPRTSTRDVLVRLFSRLKISRRRVTIDNRALVEEFIDIVDQLIDQLDPILQTPLYLADLPTEPAPRNRKSGEGPSSQRR